MLPGRAISAINAELYVRSGDERMTTVPLITPG